MEKEQKELTNLVFITKNKTVKDYQDGDRRVLPVDVSTHMVLHLLAEKIDLLSAELQAIKLPSQIDAKLIAKSQENASSIIANALNQTRHLLKPDAKIDRWEPDRQQKGIIDDKFEKELTDYIDSKIAFLKASNADAHIVLCMWHKKDFKIAKKHCKKLNISCSWDNEYFYIFPLRKLKNNESTAFN